MSTDRQAYWITVAAAALSALVFCTIGVPCLAALLSPRTVGIGAP